MKSLMKIATVLGLVLSLAPAALAQSDKQKDKSAKSTADASNDKESDAQKGDSQHPQGSGRIETICGELASVSVIGETMVDYDTGRAVVAQLTYLTILGSPAEGAAGKDADHAKTSNSTDKGDKAADSDKDKGKGKDDKDKGQMSGGSGRRRTVYQVAITSETKVEDKDSKGGRDSSKKTEGADRERSRAALEHLQLGDWVEVEFDRFKDGAAAGAGGDGASKSKHGRNRIIRGVAKSMTIVHDSEEDHRKGSADHKDGESTGKDKSKSDAGEKKSDPGR